MAAIASTSVARNLADRPAVVVERFARGGATRWYYVDASRHLARLAGMLRPGSAVSFYFDGRIANRSIDDSLVDVILDLVDAHGEAVIGVLSRDGLEIDVDFVAGLNDLTQFLGGTADRSEVFVGAFPARENDGLNVVTIDLPDVDGIVRRHPH